MSRFQALALVAVATAVWGATFTVVKAGLADSGPLTFLSLRFLLAAMLALGLGRNRTRLRADLTGLACGAALFSGFALQTSGLATTSPARSAFITAMAALLVPVVEPLFGVNRFSLRIMAGGALAAGGLGVLLRPTAGGLGVGDLLTFGCAVAFAAHLVLLQAAVQRTPAAQVNALQVVTTAALSLPAATLEGWRFTPSLRLGAALLVTAGLATVFCFWALSAAQRALSAAESSVILAFEPLAAAMVSVLLGYDRASLALLVGGSLVVSGVLVATVPAPAMRLR